MSIYHKQVIRSVRHTTDFACSNNCYLIHITGDIKDGIYGQVFLFENIANLVPTYLRYDAQSSIGMMFSAMPIPVQDPSITNAERGIMSTKYQ